MGVYAPQASALDPSKPNRTPNCKVRGSETLRSFPRSRIFRDRADEGDLYGEGEVYGCLYKRGISHYLTDDLERDSLKLTRGSGSLVVFPNDGDGSGGPTLTLYDLRRGTFGDLYIEAILTDVELRANGTVGWIGQFEGGDYAVEAARFRRPFPDRLFDTRRIRTMARGAVGPTSLVFRRSRMYWTMNGQPTGHAYP